MDRASQADPLVVLIDLEKRVRSVLTLDELYFVFVNETHGLVPYRQAILFGRDGAPLTVSGVADLEHGSPFAHWLKKFISPLVREMDHACQITSEDVDPSGAPDWASWLPTYGLLQPLTSPAGDRLGSLFLVGDRIWNEDEQSMLDVLAGAYSHAWMALGRPHKRRAWHGTKGVVKALVLTVALGVLALPVPLTVLAPAEIIAVSPAIIRIPVEGVIETVLVEPNQEVATGDMLFRMDAASERNEFAVAQKIHGSLKAQHAQLSRRALSDPRSKRHLAETVGRIKEQETRILYLEQLIKRMDVFAPTRGSVIIDDPSSWEGRPVSLGEKIMSLADQKMVEVEAWLSVEDAIDLPLGSPVRIYLNSDPLTPVDAVLRTFSYEAQPRPSGVYAHRIRGEILDKDRLPRLGLRGTARLEGETVWLAYWMLRRPIAALRQFAGI